MRLRSLCNVARVCNGVYAVQDQLCEPGGELPRPSGLEPLSGALVRDSVVLARSLRALSRSPAVQPRLLPTPPSLDVLNAEAVSLHSRIGKLDAELQILETEGGPTSSSARVREMFALLDSEGDGRINLEEFLERATLLTPVPQEKLRGTLEERFGEADVDKDGTLDFEEFSSMLSTLGSDALGPLREERADALARLLNVTLAMASQTLARELERAATRGIGRQRLTPPVRVDQLERCVDRWCAIGERAEKLAAAAAVAQPLGQPVAASAALVGSTTGVGARASGEAKVLVPGSVSPPVSQASELEALLEQIGALAADLSMPNVTVPTWPARKVVSQAVRQADAALRFCWRGLRIFAGDVVESVCLLARVVQGGRLGSSDIRTIKRTAADAVALIPYTIIMIIPLSPPGHVFAFSLLNRCFPSAVPSAFTSQRQDIDEIYSRIAAEAAGADATERSRAFKVLGGWGGTAAKGVTARGRLVYRGLRERSRGRRDRFGRRADAST
jgi:hypothetical protein